VILLGFCFERRIDLKNNNAKKKIKVQKKQKTFCNR